MVAQTHTNLEIILINDGSTDDSGAICDDWTMQDSRIVTIHQANQGVSSARNAGLDRASGEYVGFVDSDDYADVAMFEQLLAPNTEISICGLQKNYLDGKTEYKAPVLTPLIATPEALVMLMDDKHFEGFLCNKLFRRDLFETLRLDPTIHYLEDLLLVTQLFLRVTSVSYTPQILYHYCMRADNAGSQFNKKRLDELKARRQIIRLVKPISKQATQLARFYYYKRCIGIARLALKGIVRK